MTTRTGRPSGGGHPELINTEEVRVMLGAATIRSASRTLHRMGIAPVAREAGRSGMNLYDAEEVRAAIVARPGRGKIAAPGAAGADAGADLDPQPSDITRRRVGGTAP